jgi:preprotein translocase subunit SecB
LLLGGDTPSALAPDDFVPHLAQLGSAWLAETEFRVNPRFDPERHSVEYGVEVNHADPVVDSDGDTRIHVEARVTWSGAEGQDVDSIEAPFDLRLIAGGNFVWAEDRDEDYRVRWTNFNGTYLLWPYLRAYAAQIVAAAGLPPFTLPTFAVPRVWVRGGTEELTALDEGGRALPPAADHERLDAGTQP